MNRDKKGLRFQENDSFVVGAGGRSSALENVTLQSPPGTPVAASTVMRPMPGRANGNAPTGRHIHFKEHLATSLPYSTGMDDTNAQPDSARLRESLAFSEHSDTSLGILNLDDLASLQTGMEELDAELLDMSEDSNSPRSGIGDGEEVTTPRPSVSTRPRDAPALTFQYSQMSAPSIIFDESGRFEKQENELSGSSEIDTEDELDAVRREIEEKKNYAHNPEDRLGVGESRENSGHQSRLCLEGDSSDEFENDAARLAEPRQSAEGEVVILDPGDGGGGGDGMSDGDSEVSGANDPPTLTFGNSTLMAFRGDGDDRSSRDWTLSAPYNGQATGISPGDSQSRVQPVGITDVSQHMPRNFGVDKSPPKLRPSSVQNAARESLQRGAQHREAINNIDYFSGADEDDMEAAELHFKHSFPAAGAGHSDMRNLPDFNGLSNADIGFGSDEEFLAAEDGLALIDQDQQAFEEEHIFREDEKIPDDADHNASAWTLPDSSHLTLRMSLNRSQNIIHGDEKFCRISLGTFMGMRSEALGSLSGDSNAVKPNFGEGAILSPPPQPPVAWVDRSTVSDHIGEDNESEIYAASERMAGVGQYKQDASLPSGQKSPNGNIEQLQKLQSGPKNERDSVHSQRTSALHNTNSGPDKTPKYNQQVAYKLDQGNASSMNRMLEEAETSYSQAQSNVDGHITPPLDLSSIASAIAAASSNTDPQQLTAMILGISKQHQARSKRSTGASQTHAKRLHDKSKQDLNSKQTENRREMNKSGEGRLVESKLNSGIDNASVGSIRNQNQMLSVENNDKMQSNIESGLPDRERKSTGSQRKLSSTEKWEKPSSAYIKDPLKGSDNVQPVRHKNEGDGMHSHIDRPSPPHVKGNNKPSGGLTEGSNKMNAESQHSDGSTLRNSPKSAGIRPELGDDEKDRMSSDKPSYRGLNKLDLEKLSQEQEYGNHDGEIVDLGSRRSVSGMDLGGASGRHSDRNSSRLLGTDTSENRSEIGPVYSDGLPSQSRQSKAKKHSVEEWMSQQHRLNRQSHLQNMGKEFGDDSRGSVGTQNPSFRHTVESRSLSIPDGEPTKRHSGASRKQNKSDTSNGHKYPRHKRQSDQNIHSEPNSVSNIQFVHPADEPVHRRRAASSSRASPKINDGVRLSNGDGGQETERISPGVDEERVECRKETERPRKSFSPNDSQADIVIGRHHMKQTNSPSPIATPVLCRDSIDSQADAVIGRHYIKATPRAHPLRRLGSWEESKDGTSDAEVDSGFSSEHPQRTVNGSRDVRKIISDLGDVRENTGVGIDAHVNTASDRWPGNNSMNKGARNSQDAADIYRGIISPTPSPARSPVVPSHVHNRYTDVDNLVPAETSDLGSPKSNSSGSSQTRSLSGGASSIGSYSSTPKRRLDLDRQLGNQETMQGQTYLRGDSAMLSLDTQSYSLPMSNSYPTPLTNSTLYSSSVGTGFLHQYINDRPISRLLPTGTSSAGNLLTSAPVAPMIQPTNNVILTHQANPGVGLLIPQHSMTVSIPTAAPLSNVQYSVGVPSEHFTRLGLPPVAATAQHPAVPLHVQTAPSHMQELLGSNILQRPAYPAASFPTSSHQGPESSIVPTLIVPSEHRFQAVTCIGIASHDSVRLHNSSSRWLQCTIEVVTLSVNGMELTPEKYQPFITRPRIIIGPNTTEELKVSFAPRQPGLYEAKIQVGSNPVVADSEIGLVKVMAPQMMVIKAVAETPEVEVKGVISGKLDFGEMMYGCTRSKVIQINNKGHSAIPVRLFFASSATSTWYGASLRTEDQQSSSSSVSPSRPLHLKLQGRSSVLMDDNLVQPTMIRVDLWTQKGVQTSDFVGRLEDISIHLNVELDVPDRIVSLADVDLCGRTGVAKLHAANSLSLTSVGRDTVSRNLPLRNAGNLTLDLRLLVSRGDEHFDVVPDSLTLGPNQERDILVKYTPREVPSRAENLLLVQAQPDGPVYEIMLRGEASTQPKKKASTPSLLCDKQFVSWGGVPVGKSRQSKLVLRNSSSENLMLKLTVCGSKEFQLQSLHDGQEKLYSSEQIVLRPAQDYPVHVVFSPNRVATFKGSLEIKPINARTKYTLPLSGYSGGSHLVVEDVNSVGDAFVIDLGHVTPREHKVLTMKVRNTGDRAAFVKTICFSDLRARVKLPSSHFNVEPSEFVLSPQMSKTLTLIFNAKESDASMSTVNPQLVAALGLFYGDEVMRQLFRRAVSLGTSSRVLLSADNPLRGVAFDVKFLAEEHATEECDLQPDAKTRQMFYSNMSRVMVTLVGRKPNSPPRPDVKASVPGIVLQEDTLNFDQTKPMQSQMKKLNLKNSSHQDQRVKFISPRSPFSIRHHQHTIKAKHYLRLPVIYRPLAPGQHQGFLVIQTDSDHTVVAKLTGECV